jgi:hypothetical protein
MALKDERMCSYEELYNEYRAACESARLVGADVSTFGFPRAPHDVAAGGSDVSDKEFIIHLTGRIILAVLKRLAGRYFD